MVKSPLERRAQKEYASDDVFERLVTVEDPGGIASEAYHALRASISHVLADRPYRVIMLTSPNPKEGKSTTCANLGVALAQAGSSTLLMDFDLRKPILHKVFRLRNTRGVVDVLTGEHDLQAVLQEPLPNLQVAAAGAIPYNPTELLSSGRFAELMD